MNEDTFNQHLRKFLKKVGINAQREIEKAVRSGVASGTLSGNETLKANMRLEIAQLDLAVSIEDDIRLE